MTTIFGCSLKLRRGHPSVIVRGKRTFAASEIDEQPLRDNDLGAHQLVSALGRIVQLDGGGQAKHSRNSAQTAALSSILQTASVALDLVVAIHDPALKRLCEHCGNVVGWALALLCCGNRTREVNGVAQVGVPLVCSAPALGAAQ